MLSRATAVFDHYFYSTFEYDPSLQHFHHYCKTSLKHFYDAFFLFAFLEYGQRYGIENWQRIIDGSLEGTILAKREELHRAFEERWTKKHLCDKLS